MIQTIMWWVNFFNIIFVLGLPFDIDKCTYGGIQPDDLMSCDFEPLIIANYNITSLYDGDWSTYHRYEEAIYWNYTMKNLTIKPTVLNNSISSLCPENTTFKQVACDCCQPEDKYCCMAMCYECVPIKEVGDCHIVNAIEIENESMVIIKCIDKPPINISELMLGLK